MNKTISITLNGIIFNLEEDAYEELKEYLDDIRDHFRDNGEGDEILADIEASIAEKFTSKITKARQAITKKELDKILKILGDVRDITEDEIVGSGKKESEGRKKDKEAPYKTGKKLYRNPDDVVIAGVCSGLAAFFGIDSVIVRLIFAFSIFFGGFGIIAYIILWAVMPLAKTSAQKLEMEGAMVTLKKIEETVKEKSEKIRKKAKDGDYKKAASAPLRFF